MGAGGGHVVQQQEGTREHDPGLGLVPRAEVVSSSRSPIERLTSRAASSIRPRRARTRAETAKTRVRRRVVVEPIAICLGRGLQRRGSEAASTSSSSIASRASCARHSVGRSGSPRRPAGALFERRPRLLTIAHQVMRGALDQAAERAPRAVLRQQLVGAARRPRPSGPRRPWPRRTPGSAPRRPRAHPLRSRRVLQASCRHGRPMLDLVPLAPGQVVRRQSQAQGGGGRDLRVGEPIEPATQRCLAAMALVIRRVRPDQLAGLLDVPRRDGVRDRLIEVALLGVPPACARVELGFLRRCRGGEARIGAFGGAARGSDTARLGGPAGRGGGSSARAASASPPIPPAAAPRRTADP